MACKFLLMFLLTFVLFSQIQSHNLRSACELAVDRESCRSSLLQNPRSANADLKDLTEIAVEKSLAHAENVYDLIPPTGWVSRAFDEKSSQAIENCLTFYELALNYLKAALSKLTNSGAASLKMDHVDDIQALLSAALTSQRTCLKGLQQANVNISQFAFASNIQNASRSVSDSLALINKLLIAGKVAVPNNRRLLSHGDDFHFVRKGFPSWLPRADKRRLLGSPEKGISEDVTVAQDGSGDYKNIADAIKNAPENSNKRYVIRIKSGLYQENIRVPSSKTNIMLVGDGMDTTVITSNRSVTDGWSIIDSATLAVLSNGFIARDLTIENTAGPTKQQAVAIMLVSDMAALYRCKMIGFQNTLYAQSLRQFFRECDIHGSIDFICGNAAALFQKCNILVRKPLNGQENVITAQGRTEPNEKTGIVIQDCKVIAASDMVSLDSSVLAYLGRPWGKYSRTIYMQTYLANLIRPEGWLPLYGDAATNTVYFGEYENRGPGARNSDRINSPGFHLMSSLDAQQFTISALFDSNGWLPSTTVPFQAGLV